MKLIFTLLFSLFLGSSFWVDKDEPDFHEPDWVMEIIDAKPKFTKITRCAYGEEFVWKVNSCVTYNDMITKVYDSDKNLVCQYGGVLRQNTCRDENVDLDDCRIIYGPKTKVTIGF